MIRYFYFAAFLLFFSCSEENKSEQMKTDQSKTPNYGHSNVELITQKDSVSYVVGLKYSEQFHGQEVFKSLDKELISQGFSDEIGSYDINKCFSDVEAYLASESMRNNKSFTDSCSRSFGRFSIYNFTESLAQLAALEMLNINSICLGFSDGIRQKNVFRENIEIESRIYYEFQKEVFDDLKFLKRNNRCDYLNIITTTITNLSPCPIILHYICISICITLRTKLSVSLR